MSKYAVLAGLGEYYGRQASGYRTLPFAYRNVVSLMTKLHDNQWITPPPLINEAATKDNIFFKLSEVTKQAVDNDTVLFYFTGHGDRHVNVSSSGTDHYLVTATSLPPNPSTFNIAAFLNEINYGEIISQFSDGKRHLVTIIDCCYAFGLIDGYEFQQDFHTVIAASSENNQSFFNSNSLFFQALMASWNEPSYTRMKAAIEAKMIQLRSPTPCKIRSSAT